MPKLPALPYVRAGVTNGLSANAALREYQAAAAQAAAETGVHYTAMRRTNFLQIYSEVRNVRAGVVTAMQAPKNEPAGGLVPHERTTVRSTGYLNWGVGFSRLIGSSDVEQTFHAIRSLQPMTPQEVEDAIRQQILESSQEAHGSFANFTLEGVVFTGVEHMTPGGG